MKEIKNSHSIKDMTTITLHLIEFNNRNITDPTAAKNTFNNYFTYIAQKIKSDVNFSLEKVIPLHK